MMICSKETLAKLSRFIFSHVYFDHFDMDKKYEKERSTMAFPAPALKLSGFSCGENAKYVTINGFDFGYQRDRWNAACWN